MAELEKANTIAKQTVEEMASRLAEPVWLLDNRLAAWEAYYKTPMPNDRDEGWKRTNIAALELSGLQTSNLPAAVASDNSDKSPAWLKSVFSHFEGGKIAGLLYQNTNEAGFYTLDKKLADKGVILCDIATAVVKHADKIKPYLSTSVDAEEDGKFGLLSKALFNCGLFLYIPRGVEISEPFFYAIDFASMPKTSTGVAVLPRTLVVAEDQSASKLVYVIHSSEESQAEKQPVSLLSQYVEIHVKPSAKVSFLEVQQQNSELFTVNRSNCLVDRDGRYESLTLALGGCQTKSDMATVLRAPGASSEILGVVLGAGEEKYSFNTIQEHAACDTKSDINFRVALKDKSSSVYQGIVRVAKVAQRTDAFQSNKNLLLEGTATADSIPKLEILADDVKCAHGATVGPVDREQIFYLMSRGVSRSVAEQLIVLGFFRQTLERSPFKSALTWLSENISRKIHGGKLDSSATDFFAEPE
ncbi:MAG: Fe-S cluster assembly protein SufD [Candidatus Obscuribacterales bacterium]|nr:Fe-S cluster assembly protein SufD [Candidatus Obscuribacterales bacterium]